MNEGIPIGVTDSNVVIGHSRLQLRVFQRGLAGTVQRDIRTESECNRIPALNRMVRADIPVREKRIYQTTVKLVLLCPKPTHAENVCMVKTPAAFVQLQIERISVTRCKAWLRRYYIV